MDHENEQRQEEQNRDLVRRLMDHMVRDPSDGAIDEFLSEDFVDHNAPPEQGPGPEGVKRSLKKTLAALANLRLQLEDIIAEGDKVVIRYKAEATHVGSFLGFPATGRRLSWTTISIYRIAGAKIVERWGLVDHTALVHQLRGDAK